eukprot:gb/GECG01012126.1/.p1 GENE.gb/GECG01012126.1/~~gb/GECG01012126.1/.p1  ORF type:complete len:556 (+),score=85.50 gb/GECG01012126.1/:1-1668(+)
MSNLDGKHDNAKMGMADEEINKLPTLERTMVKTFGLFVSISMALIVAILIVSIIVTGNATENISEEGLEDQIKGHLRSSAEELTAKIDLRFSTVEDSVVKFMASIHGQAAEDGSSDILEFQEDKNFETNEMCDVMQELFVRLPEDKNGTLDYSVYGFGESVDSIDSTTRKNINDSFTMQYFYRNLWRNNDPVVAMYTGYENSKSLWRYYPGVCGIDFKPLDQRQWYTLTNVDGSRNQINHIGPYKDAFGLGWMITIAHGVFSGGIPEQDEDANDNKFIGVSAADITLDQLQREILSVRFFNQSTASMFRYEDERVVEDPFWDGNKGEGIDDPTSPAGGVATPKVEDVHPGIGSVMSQIKDLDEGSKIITYERDGKTWILARAFVPPHPDVAINPDSTFEEWKNPRYVVFVEAPEEEVLSPLSDLRDEISASRRNLVIIAVFLSIGVWLIVLGLIKLVSNRITGPLRRMMDTAKLITDQAAEDDQMEGELDTDIPEPNDEIGEFVREFKTMVHGLNKGGVKGSKVHNYIDNPFYRPEGASKPELPWEDVLRDINKR